MITMAKLPEDLPLTNTADLRSLLLCFLTILLLLLALILKGFIKAPALLKINKNCFLQFTRNTYR